MPPAAPARPTIIDVATRAGVSKSLVSLVMRGESAVSEEKRRLVLEAAQALGYRPNAVARSLVRRRTNLLGVVLSDLHNPFYAEVVDGIQAEAGEHGYRMIASTVDRRAMPERRALDTLLELRVDGLILASPMHELDGVVDAASREVPVVLVARRSDVARVDSVRNDDSTGAGLVVEHLARLGHRRIAHIDGGDGSGAPERREGYERAMRAHGLGAEVRVVPGTYTEDGGRRGVAALLDADRPRPTAIFVANDLAAVGALGVLADRGLRVPEDVSIVGYDNTALAAMRHIDLTTVDQPRPELGREAVTLLLERLHGRDTTRHLLMPPSLVVRGTTAPPTS